MSIVKIKDKTFKTSIPEEEILKKVQVVADRINQDMDGKNPLFLAVLNGAFIFAADLMRMVTIPSEISFVKEKKPASINVCSLLVKPGNLRVPLDIKYAVMEIPNDFIVGYGLDYDQQGRNLRDIYTIVED